jgi:hypothetical protein
MISSVLSRNLLSNIHSWPTALQSTLGTLGASFLQFGNKRVLFFCYSLLHFFPSGWAVLVFNANDCVDDFVDFSLVFVRNFYPRLMKDCLKMPEITGHRNSPKDLMFHPPMFNQGLNRLAQAMGTQLINIGEVVFALGREENWNGNQPH